MAEMAVTDGRPPPAVPTGDCLCTRLPDGGIRIDTADPRIIISGELLDAIAGVPDSPLPISNAWLVEPIPHLGSYVGAVLHIDGVNRHVIYRITHYLPRIGGYIGEWPD